MGKEWYTLNTYSGYEQKIQRTIENMRSYDSDFAEAVSDVWIPVKTEYEVKVVENKKDGTKKEVKKPVFKKILPGYILVEIDFPENNWKDTYLKIRRIHGVTGFLNAVANRKPRPLSAVEVKSLKTETGDVPAEKAFKPKQNFEVGEEVKVIEGPFDTFTGKIEEIDSTKGKLRISVQIFGRSTPVEVEFTQVEKVVL